MVDKKKGSFSALFKIISRCNDFCNFCIERKNIDKGRDDLSSEEIKSNFEYLKNNFRLNDVVISGGEPTIHPNFIEIINYFYDQNIEFRVITNFLEWRNESFLKKMIPVFKRNNGGRIKRCKIIGSIKELPDTNKDSSFKRIEGLKKILRHRLPLSQTGIVITKDNVNYLEDLVAYLASIYKKYNPDWSVSIGIRMMYIADMLPSSIKISLPTDFENIKRNVQKAIDMANSLGVNLDLWNFPLCYIENPPKLMNKMCVTKQKMMVLKVDKDFQMENVRIRDNQEYFKKEKYCSNCRYDVYCSGIHPSYIKKYHFPKLTPFTR